MATKQDKLTKREITQYFKDDGITDNEMPIALKSYDILNNHLSGEYKEETCLLNNCRANHRYREILADKKLLRNLEDIVKAGGILKPKNKPKTTNNQDEANEKLEDTRQISLLVFFGLAFREEIVDLEGKNLGTCYTITQNGRNFLDGNYKIPLKITIRDGKLVDKTNKFMITKDYLCDEIYARAKFKKTTGKKYTPLDTRVLTLNNIEFSNVEEYMDYVDKLYKRNKYKQPVEDSE